MLNYKRIVDYYSRLCIRLEQHQLNASSDLCSQDSASKLFRVESDLVRQLIEFGSLCLPAGSLCMEIASLVTRLYRVNALKQYSVSREAMFVFLKPFLKVAIQCDRRDAVAIAERTWQTCVGGTLTLDDYSFMMELHVQNRDFCGARQLYSRILALDLSPCVVSPRLMTAVVSFLAASDDLGSAEGLVACLSKQGVTIDPKVYSQILKGYLDTRQYNLARIWIYSHRDAIDANDSLMTLKLWVKSVSKLTNNVTDDVFQRVEPLFANDTVRLDPEMCFLLLRLALVSSDFRRAHHYFAKFDELQMDVAPHWTYSIEGLRCAYNILYKKKRLRRTMKRKFKQTESLVISDRFYSSLIYVMLKHHRYHNAEDAFEELRRNTCKNLKIPVDILHMLLSYYYENRKFDQGIRFYKLVAKSDLEFNSRLYDIVLKLLRTQNTQLEHMKVIWKQFEAYSQQNAFKSIPAFTETSDASDKVTSVQQNVDNVMLEDKNPIKTVYPEIRASHYESMYISLINAKQYTEAEALLHKFDRLGLKMTPKMTAAWVLRDGPNISGSEFDSRINILRKVACPITLPVYNWYINSWCTDPDKTTKIFASMLEDRVAPSYWTFVLLAKSRANSNDIKGLCMFIACAEACGFDVTNLETTLAVPLWERLKAQQTGNDDCSGDSFEEFINGFIRNEKVLELARHCAKLVEMRIEGPESRRVALETLREVNFFPNDALYKDFL